MEAHCHLEDDDADQDAVESLTDIVADVLTAVEGNDYQGLSNLLSRLPEQIRLNQTRMAVQVLSCVKDRVAAHVPLRPYQVAGLMASIGGSRVHGLRDHQ
jgi:hypothetical protein